MKTAKTTDKQQSSSASNGMYPFILERRDGSFFQTNMKLSHCTPVESILQSMTRALEKAGAASLPLPPSDDELEHQSNFDPQKNTSTQSSSSSTRSSAPTSKIDHRFDIMSQRGRDFMSFLSNLSQDEVRNRKASRMDAQAAALEVRRRYQFQAVDGTTLGWSSASVAVLLNQLLKLHDGHSDKFLVKSFYPCRLFFTSDDFHEELDVYGGVLRMNPAATPLQWLDAIRMVTPDTIQLIKNYRTELAEKTLLVQGILGVKVKRGHSCSSREYYDFLSRLCPSSTGIDVNKQENALVVSPQEDEDMSGLILEPVTLSVESSSRSGRRALVTKEGSIRIGAAFLEDEVRLAISKLAGPARKQAYQNEQERERCKQAIHQIQWQVGLEAVYRSGVGVNNSQFLDCLARILQLEDERLKINLTGNSLGIACSGNFCHLADDGSVVIPYDWK